MKRRRDQTIKPTPPAFAWPVALAFICIVAVAATAFVSPRDAAAGWLIAFIAVSAVPLGSLVLLMIHRLTGGRWGDALQPTLQHAVVTVPWLGLLFVPVIVSLPVLYPWMSAPATIAPDVARFYLNAPLFIGRSIGAFVGWGVLAVMLSRGTRFGLLPAGLGLLFHAVMMSLVSIDWILSVEAPFISTSFGATVVAVQMLSALAFAALAAPENVDEGAWRDLGALILAFSLGVTYLNFMSVLVIWYGDLPDRVAWFILRIGKPWLSCAVAAFLFASLVPALLLLLARVRQSRVGLRWVAASILAGVTLFDVWLIAPAFGRLTLATAPLATIAIVSVLTIAGRAGWLDAVLARTRLAR